MLGSGVAPAAETRAQRSRTASSDTEAIASHKTPRSTVRCDWTPAPTNDPGRAAVLTGLQADNRRHVLARLLRLGEGARCVASSADVYGLHLVV